jgi:hypothetical protein
LSLRHQTCGESLERTAQFIELADVVFRVAGNPRASSRSLCGKSFTRGED